MANPSKQKGTKAESDLVKWLRGNGFPHAERLALTGSKDSGDIRLTPLGWTAGLVTIEVKAHATTGRGIPADGLLLDWLAQAETERANAGAAHCPLILRRTGPGAGDPARWWAWIPAWSLRDLLRAPIDLPDPAAPVCMSVASLAALLRAAGYGAELEGRGAVA